jgi:peptidyl-tRNA hydrolase
MKRFLKQVILLRRDMKLRRAEAAALASKASMTFIIEGDESDRSGSVKVDLSGIEAEWMLGSATRIVLGVASEESMRKLLLKAEIQGVSTYEIIGASDDKAGEGIQLIAASLGPDDGDKLDLITGNLKLF